MKNSELAKLLREHYEAAPSRDKAAHVVLFAIKYADELQGHSTAEIAEQSGIGKWGPQVALGRKLAKHVELRA